MSNDYEIGIKIKQRRKSLGLTAEYIADQLGVAPSTIYRYENGEISNMGVTSMKKLANVLRLNVADLLGMSDSNSNCELSSREMQLISVFRKLNEEGQEKMIDNGRDLVASGRYIKNNESGMVGEKSS